MFERKIKLSYYKRKKDCVMVVKVSASIMSGVSVSY